MSISDDNFKFFKEYFGGIKYTDDFGCNQTWNRKINQWLELVYEIDKNYYEKGKTRVKQNSGYSRNEHRDAFLSEALSIFYFRNSLNVKEIKIEPNKHGKNDIDFSCTWFDNKKWFVEVKAPSWHKEIVKDPNNIIQEEKNRLKEPQYKNNENDPFSFESDIRVAVEDSIKNSLGKFEKNKNNALVIIPNMKRFLLENIYSYILENIIKDEVEEQDRDNLISKVIVIEKALINNSVKYEYLCVDLKGS